MKTQYKVGDIIGNTVQGFTFKVLSINGNYVMVENIITNQILNTYSDNMYLSIYYQQKLTLLY